VFIVVLHAVHTGVLTLPTITTADWIGPLTSFIEDNKILLHEKVNIITAQVTAIVGKMQHRNIIQRLVHLPWKFSAMEATIFATELSQSIEPNLT
jgi:precorrin isomerase